METIEKIYRKVTEYGDHYAISFRRTTTHGNWYFHDYVSAVASDFNVPSGELKELAERLVKELFNMELRDLTYFKVEKTGKTSDEIKREIKEITRKFEKFLDELIRKAEEIRERTDVSGWLWEKAKFDVSKRKFVKFDGEDQ